MITNSLSQKSAFTLIKIQIHTSIYKHFFNILYGEGTVPDVAECRNECKTWSLSLQVLESYHFIPTFNIRHVYNKEY